jgi:DNA-binding NarL/FixJ family response regulator
MTAKTSQHGGDGPQPEVVAVQVILVSPPGPFSECVAVALQAIQPKCTIRQVASCSEMPRSAKLDPALILLDVDAHPAQDLEALSALEARYPDTPLVVLASSLDEGFMDRAFQAGAAGYIPKNYSAPLVEGALRIMFGGERYRPHAKPRGPAKRGRPRKGNGESDSEDLFGLTAREKEVLSEMARGLTNIQIGNRLGLKLGTVKTHVDHILKKMGAENRSQAAMQGLRLVDIQRQQIREAEQGRLNLSWLQSEMSHRRMRSGQAIFRIGDIGKELFYVQRGRVRLPEIDVTVEPGNVFGEIGIFTPEHRRTCSALCVSDVDLFTLSADQVKRIYFSNPQFAFLILNLVATRLMADRRRLRSS